MIKRGILISSLVATSMFAACPDALVTTIKGKLPDAVSVTCSAFNKQNQAVTIKMKNGFVNKVVFDGKYIYPNVLETDAKPYNLLTPEEMKKNQEIQQKEQADKMKPKEISKKDFDKYTVVNKDNTKEIECVDVLCPACASKVVANPKAAMVFCPIPNHTNTYEISAWLLKNKDTINEYFKKLSTDQSLFGKYSQDKNVIATLNTMFNKKTTVSQEEINNTIKNGEYIMNTYKIDHTPTQMVIK